MLDEIETAEVTPAHAAVEQAIEAAVEERAADAVANASAIADAATAHAERVTEQAAAEVAAVNEQLDQGKEDLRWRSLMAQLEQQREQIAQLTTLLRTQQEMMATFSGPLLDLIRLLREEADAARAASSKSTRPKYEPEAIHPEAVAAEAENGGAGNPAARTGRAKLRRI
jgi:hypothetical protein